MMINSRQKCCLHCPDTWISSQIKREHSCHLPIYVKGNLKLSSLKKYVSGEAERHDRLAQQNSEQPEEESTDKMSRQNSVYDRFAIAKKFHANNLEHQPLPDKIDDSVFKNVRPDRNILLSKSSPNLRKIDGERLSRLKNASYGPSLGCKVPTTNMDLAICWEAPVDSNYEPMWPVHIDGSDGGPGPAVFALVQHEPGDDKDFKSPVERFEAKFINVKGRSKRDGQSCQTCQADLTCENNLNGNDLCNDFQGIQISEEVEDNRLVKSANYGCPNPKKRQPVHLRNCASSCHCKGERMTRSRCAHSATNRGGKNIKRNGLPNKVIVPRPRTPYAKRNFCIDSLTPPFSIVEGSRDADYPEHWRLMSVYQQSYRNPKNQ